MPRPKSNRIVKEPPLFTEFKPVGIPGRSLEQIKLSLDEFESIRLADQLGFSHEEAADEMGISRSTFSRLVEKSRKKMAEFIFGGKVLVIEGGNVHFRKNILRCNDCGHMFKTDIGEVVSQCPICHSEYLMNLAGGFGHGKCCVERIQEQSESSPARDGLLKK